MGQVKLFPLQTKIFDILTSGDEKITELLIGGGAGGSKSFLGCLRIIFMCITYPGINAGIGRSDISQLKATTLVTFFEVMRFMGLDDNDIKIKTDPETTATVIYFIRRRSRVFMIDLKHYPQKDPMFTKLGGLLLTILFIDELPEIKRKAYDIIATRVGRWRNEELGIPPRLLASCNPVRNWVYKYFIYRDKIGTLPNHIKFISMLAKDNPYIPKAYLLKLKNMEEGPDKERLYKGNWDYDNTPGKLYEYHVLLDLFSPKVQESTERYITSDVATTGKDKALVFVWEGFKLIDYRKADKCETTDIENEIKRYAILYNISLEDNTLVDQVGEGKGIPSHLKCIGFVGNSSVLPDENGEKPNYQNLRCQMYFDLQNHIRKLDLSIILDPDMQQEIIEDLYAIKEIDFDKLSKRKINSKEDIKEDIGRSPDYGDTISMRCYWECLFEESREIVA